MGEKNRVVWGTSPIEGIETSSLILSEFEAEFLRWSTGKPVEAGQTILIEKGFNPHSIDFFIEPAATWLGIVGKQNRESLKTLHCAVFGFPREAIQGTLSPAASTIMVVGLANLEELEEKTTPEGHMDLHSILEGWRELGLPELPIQIQKDKERVLRFAEALAVAWIGEV